MLTDSQKVAKQQALEEDQKKLDALKEKTEQSKIKRSSKILSPDVSFVDGTSALKPNTYDSQIYN